MRNMVKKGLAVGMMAGVLLGVVACGQAQQGGSANVPAPALSGHVAAEKLGSGTNVASQITPPKDVKELIAFKASEEAVDEMSKRLAKVTGLKADACSEAAHAVLSFADGDVSKCSDPYSLIEEGTEPHYSVLIDVGKQTLICNQLSDGSLHSIYMDGSEDYYTLSE